MTKPALLPWRHLALVVLLAGSPVAVRAETADAAYVNGRIYTVDAAQSWAEAVAIKDGQFIVVGNNEAIEPLIGDATRVTDLGGRMAMPGIHDLHIHPMEGTLTALYGCNFPPGSPLSEITARIKSCADAQPPGTWIRGGVFAAQLLDSQPPLHRSMLDAVAPEHPVILHSSGGHTAWVNSAALQAAGIDRGTPDPENGFIAHDKATGEPTGLLHESAGRLVQDKVPGYSAEQYATAVATFVRDLNRQGITSIKDASVSPELMQVYARAEQSGTLTLRLATSLVWRNEGASAEERLATLKARQQYRTERINPDFVKIFVDGSAGSRKAKFLEPYKLDDRHGAYYSGEFLVDPEVLKDYLILLDREGVSVKMHCGGDAAVRAALDAIEAARRVNGDSGIPHEISHPNLVHADDILRFKPLNAVADLTPVTWYPNPILDLLARALGQERVQQMWRIRAFVESGAVAVYGSDWPAVTPNTNPWRAMEAMITRRNPDTDSGEAFVPDQAIDLATAIRIFTRNGAYAMRHDDRVGTIEVNRAADLIVLADNLFEIPAERIDATRVVLTVLNGEEVYRDETMAP